MSMNPCCGVSLKIGVPYLAMFDIIIATVYLFVEVWRILDFMGLDDKQQMEFLFKAQWLYPNGVSRSVTAADRESAFKLAKALYYAHLAVGILGHLIIIAYSVFFIFILQKNNITRWILIWLVMHMSYVGIYFTFLYVLRRSSMPSNLPEIASFSYWLFYKFYELFVVFTLYRGLKISNAKRMSQVQPISIAGYSTPASNLTPGLVQAQGPKGRQSIFRDPATASGTATESEA